MYIVMSHFSYLHIQIHHLHMAPANKPSSFKKKHPHPTRHAPPVGNKMPGRKRQKDGKSSDVCWQTVDATADPNARHFGTFVQKTHAMKGPKASHVFWFPGIRREPGAVATYRLVFGLLFAFMKENPAKFFHQSTIGLAGFKVSWMVQGFTNHDIQGDLYLIWYAHQEWWLSLEMYQSWDSRVWLF